MNRTFVVACLVCGCSSLPPVKQDPPAVNAPPQHLTASTHDATPKPDGVVPPLAKKLPTEHVLFGHELTDDYAWLRNKGTPDVESYLEAENAYTAAKMEGTAPLQKTLYDEMLARIQEDDATPPVREAGWLYYRRYEKGKQYAIHCRKSATAKDAHEEILLDLNEIGRTEKFVDVHGMHVSDDGTKLAFLIDTAGFRQYTLKIKDLKTGMLGAEAIPRVDGVAWAKDGKTLLYVTEDAQTKRADKLFRHALGDDAAKDALVYEEKDAMFELGVERTRSRAYFVVTSSSHTTSEVRVIDAKTPAAAPRVVAPREHDHEYYVDHRGDLFYIRTNSGGRNFRIVTAKADDPKRESWKELVAHRADVAIEDLLLFEDHMVTFERGDALPQIAITDLKTGKSRRVEQPEPTFSLAGDENLEFATTKLRFKYQSLKTPLSYVEIDTKTMARAVLKQTAVLGGYDANAYETKRIVAPARDGTMVPVSLVYKKGTTPDGSHPLFLYAYGSYGYSPPLSFSSDRVSLLDRGFVYAHAHIRGGGDMGKKWHDQGRMSAKMNTFTDFIDVAEHLGKEGWAKKDALVVQGGSAGGLLMGAVANLRPDLFSIVLANVPFVDVMNTMLDETLPLTVGEFEEWGNPKKKDDFETMLRYSPYDNVVAKRYPTMLVRTSYNDSQVMYWEPAKWVAKLRVTKTDTNPLLFKINMQPAGHGGQSGRYDRLHDTAFDYAFVLSRLQPSR